MKYLWFIVIFLLQFNLAFANCDQHFLKTLTLKLSNKTNEDEITALLIGDKLTAFEEFLVSKNLTFEKLSQTQKKNYFLESIESQFSRYKDEEFSKAEKNQSRLNYLKLRGHKMVGTDGDIIMKKQSTKNLKQALGNGPKHIYGSVEWQEVEEFLGNLKLHFKHNSQILSGDTTLPILSSKRLEDIFGIGGLNSRYEFNKNILKSDDSVYFVPQPNLHGKYNVQAGDYGAYSMYLNEAYAGEQGMISSFVMYEEELMLWGEVHAPELVKKMHDKTIAFYSKLSDDEKFQFKEVMRIDWMYSVEAGQFKLGKLLKATVSRGNIVQPELVLHWKSALGPDLTELRQNLYKTDYTVSDFTVGLKEIIMQEAVKMKADVQEIQSLKNAFNDGHWKYSTILQNALKRMGFPTEGMTFPIELTVPVNVPATKIKFKGQK